MPTPRANLALLSEGQAQKVFTINENFAQLEALTVGGVVSLTTATPPGSPVEGVTYIIPVSPAPTDAWAGQSKKLAYFHNGAWLFFAPKNGWFTFVADQGRFFWYNGTSTLWEEAIAAAAIPVATGSVLGGVKIGSGVSIDAGGVISVASYSLPIATGSVLGGVKIGGGISIDGAGVISVTPYSLPIATGSVLGGVKIGGGVNVDVDGAISVTPYSLPIASGSTLGGIRIGSGLSIDGSGVVSATTSATNLSQNKVTSIASQVISAGGSATINLLTGLPTNSWINEISFRIPVSTSPLVTVQIGEPSSPNRYLSATAIFAHEEAATFTIAPFTNRNSQTTIQAIISNPGGTSATVSAEVDIVYAVVS